MKQKTRPARPAIKANPMLFKFKKPLEQFLRKEAAKTGKTLVRTLEEMLEERMRYKPVK